MAIRVFECPFVVVVDTNQADAAEDDTSLPDFNAKDVHKYLVDALHIDWNTDEYGNPLGVCAIEVHHDMFREWSTRTVAKKFENKGDS